MDPLIAEDDKGNQVWYNGKTWVPVERVPEVGGAEAMAHPDTSRNEPGAGYPMAQLGRGIQDASARMLLGARQLMGMEKPEEAQAIRAQLEPQTGLERVGQVAPAATMAAAVPGAGLLTDMAVGGGLNALESGNPADAVTGALTTGTASGAMRGLARFLPGSIDRNIAKIALDPAERAALAKRLIDRVRGLGMTVGGVAGGAAGRTAGVGATIGALGGGAVGDIVGKSAADPIAQILTSGQFNALSARAKLKVYDVLRSGDSDKILTTLWRLLPEQRQQSQGVSDSMTAGDMLAEAKRRKAANAVLR